MAHDIEPAEHNVYAPPQARVAEVADRADSDEFFVVAPRKVLVMLFFTLGFYQLYWFYMHWARYRRRHRESLWPVARAIFAIFFMHGLNGEIDDSLRKSRTPWRWSPGMMATWFVVCTIARNILGQLGNHGIGAPYTNLCATLLLIPVAPCLLATQRAANAACGDPGGRANARLTMANLAWLALGCLVWLSYLFGIYVSLHPLHIRVDLPQH